MTWYPTYCAFVVAGPPGLAARVAEIAALFAHLFNAIGGGIGSTPDLAKALGEHLRAHAPGIIYEYHTEGISQAMEGAGGAAGEDWAWASCARDYTTGGAVFRANVPAELLAAGSSWVSGMLPIAIPAVASWEWGFGDWGDYGGPDDYTDAAYAWSLFGRACAEMAAKVSSLTRIQRLPWAAEDEEAAKTAPVGTLELFGRLAEDVAVVPGKIDLAYPHGTGAFLEHLARLPVARVAWVETPGTLRDDLRARILPWEQAREDPPDDRAKIGEEQPGPAGRDCMTPGVAAGGA